MILDSRWLDSFEDAFLKAGWSLTWIDDKTLAGRRHEWSFHLDISFKGAFGLVGPTDEYISSEKKSETVRVEYPENPAKAVEKAVQRYKLLSKRVQFREKTNVMGEKVRRPPDYEANKISWEYSGGVTSNPIGNSTGGTFKVDWTPRQTTTNSKPLLAGDTRRNTTKSWILTNNTNV